VDPTQKQIRALVQDALKVRDYPLNTQEGFLELIIQQAVVLGHQQAVAMLQARMTGACAKVQS
jgi:hypothetical protein